MGYDSDNAEQEWLLGPLYSDSPESDESDILTIEGKVLAVTEKAVLIRTTDFYGKCKSIKEEWFPLSRIVINEQLQVGTATIIGVPQWILQRKKWVL